jgi:hypothetical protein
MQCRLCGGEYPVEGPPDATPNLVVCTGDWHHFAIVVVPDTPRYPEFDAETNRRFCDLIHRGERR